MQIEPFVSGFSKGAIVQVESIDINDCTHVVNSICKKPPHLHATASEPTARRRWVELIIIVFASDVKKILRSEAGLTNHVWSVEELTALLPTEQPKKRCPYKKRVAA